jgi:hypothetical protein
MTQLSNTNPIQQRETEKKKIKPKYKRKQAGDPCHDSHTKYRRHDRVDRGKDQTNCMGYVYYSDESDSEQPSDEDKQGDILRKERYAAIEKEKMEDKAKAKASMQVN